MDTDRDEAASLMTTFHMFLTLAFPGLFKSAVVAPSNSPSCLIYASRRWLVCCCVCDAHADGRNSADNCYVLRVVYVPGLSARFARWHQNQVVVVQLTPTADIRVTELEKIDRTIVIAVPAER